MRLEISDKDSHRFWSKVDQSDDCWIWTKMTRNGYGLFKYKNYNWAAHRFAFALTNDLDETLQVCHRCDNPPCCNPAHLFQGTAKINSDDKLSKNRGSGVLTNEQVLDMRSRPLTNTMVRDLAEEFEVKPSWIKRALTGQTYGHLPNAVEIPKQFTGWTLTPEQVAEIREELRSPYWGQQTALGQKYGVPKATINHIAKSRLLYSEPK